MALDPSYTGFALHQRALDALRQRNEARRTEAAEQGQPWNPWYAEQADPNFGMWGDVLQGMNEAAAEQGATRARFRTPQPMGMNPAIQGLLKVR